MGPPPGQPPGPPGQPPGPPDQPGQQPPGEEWPKATSSSTEAGAIEWMPIDPNKPDGPKMAPVSGNPKQGAFSALVKLPAGHGSGLHSHPATMHGVVISGTVKNGRSAEDAVAIQAGTKWTQPGGEVHFTGCSAEAECIFVGHMEGAMGTTPADAPVQASTQTVTAGGDLVYSPVYPNAPEGPGVHVLSGDMKSGAFQALIRFPAGSTTPKHSHTASYSAAVITGALSHGDGNVMTPGSLWEQKGGRDHTTVCGSQEQCVFFAAMDGAMDMIADGPPGGP